MHKQNTYNTQNLPLSGYTVIERSQSVAAAYAGRLLAMMGAKVCIIESKTGTPLRQASPLLPDGQSALFAYLAAGKDSIICDLESDSGQKRFNGLLTKADIFIDDTPLKDRNDLGLSTAQIKSKYPNLVHVSVLPFGAYGEKANWVGSEVNLLHAGGEGYLLPNGLTNELFPDRPPLKIYGYFASYQGGTMAALSALSALWAVPASGGQFVDVSVQDAVLAVSAFALQRLGDGSLEHRSSRSFRYGGVFKTRTGYVELLTLEDRQWNSLVELLGNPEWSKDTSLNDPLERSRRGAEINKHIRKWMADHDAIDVVKLAQELGVPVAKYRSPSEVISGKHEAARNLFAPIKLINGDYAQALVAPFQFCETPLKGAGSVPGIGSKGT